jgi:hypothetical protein
MTPTHALQSYSTHDAGEGVFHSFQDLNELLDILMMQDTVFKSISLAMEINKLNGYKLISDYHIKMIKQHYGQIQIREIKSKIRESKQRELQKGYIQLLSNQISN